MPMTCGTKRRSDSQVTSGPAAPPFFFDMMQMAFVLGLLWIGSETRSVRRKAQSQQE